MIARLAGLIAIFVVAAACLEGEPVKPGDYQARATDGWFAVGFAYDGKLAAKFDNAVIDVRINDADNAGRIEASGKLNNKTWIIVFDRFAEQSNKSFQNGGVAMNLDEHGATGHGDTSIPQVHADAAAWGEANVTVDGQRLRDAITGQDTWVAHAMVLTTGVRDDGTHGVYADAAHTKMYDPATPAVGVADPNDPEIHLVLRGHRPPALEDRPVEASGRVSSPEYSADQVAFNNSHLGSAANLTLGVEPQTITPVATYDLECTLRDPDGQALITERFQGTATVERNVKSHTIPLLKTGNYTLHVEGSGVGAEYFIEGSITPPPDVVLNFWWEQVTFGTANGATPAKT
jgi:hypothetical protein